MDMNPNERQEKLDLYFSNFSPAEKARPFFVRLVNGVMDAQQDIDTVIERFSDNWKMSRMSGVDRNILRVAVYEMLFCKDIPSKVSINEAIDIGKKFGTDESGSFINGILDSIRLAQEQQKL
jgi:N utilization substance protein B